jgi:hypothetical protein
MSFPKRVFARAKAKIEPQLHWQVPQEKGEWANDPRWSNKGKFYWNSQSFYHAYILQILTLCLMKNEHGEERITGHIGAQTCLLLH